jgi:endogenous inhibitor of DNA gyrase (YacG/DUF329 family)
MSNSKFLTERIPKICDQCHGKMEVLPCHQQQRFCSIPCKLTYFKNRSKGQKYRDLDCLNCGKNFRCWQSKPRAYCSAQCYQEARRASYPKTVIEKCKYCQEDFECYRKERRIYCSQECKGLGTRTNLRDRVCLHCKETFQRKPSSSQRFCTLNCYSTHRSSMVGRIQKSCEKCGTTMLLMPSFAARRFCSHQCAGLKHGETIAIYPPRARERLRGSSFARKNLPLRCAICGWEDSVDMAHIVAAKDGGSHEIENRVPLCPNHHIMFDRGRISIEKIREARHKLMATLSANA